MRFSARLLPFLAGIGLCNGCAHTQEQKEAQLMVYTGPACSGLAATHAFERRYGRRVDGVIKFLDNASWQNMFGAARSGRKCWPDKSYNMAFSVPMLMRGGNMKAGAQGAYDAEFRKLAAFLVESGRGDAYLRLGWEFNAGWYNWSANRDPELWKAYFRRIVGIFRNTEGAKFKIVWNTASGKQAIEPDKAYPGDDVVDVIAMDMYNALSDGTSDSRWQEYLNRPYGLEWLRTFAKEHDKPIALPEWGTGYNAKGKGGGDDPDFIRHMGEWIAANNVAFHGYWNYQAKDFKSSLTVGQYPKSEEAFRTTFANNRSTPNTDVK